MDSQPQPQPAVSVARACAEDWAAVRAVRLAALADAPSAFGSTLSREQAFDERRWRSWTSSAALFIASGDGAPSGMAAGIAGESDDERALVAVWVHPQWRGRGTSAVLLDGVEQWARGAGACRIRLWLTQGNAPARGLYSRRGYVETGRTKAHPNFSGLLEDEMVLDLLS